MTTQSIMQDHEKELQRLLEDATPNVAFLAIVDAKLSKDGARCAIEHFGEIKAEMQQAIVGILKRRDSQYPVLAETRLLKPVGKSTVPARTKPFNAAAFYQTGTGLYIHDTFADRLDIHARQTVDSTPACPYVASLLKANAYDRDIREELPENHLSTLEDIAALIEAQPGGQSGLLLNNGSANIFYVEGKGGVVFAVGVRRDSDDRRWRVNVWKIDEFGRWHADDQVLCPGNAAL